VTRIASSLAPRNDGSRRGHALGRHRQAERADPVFQRRLDQSRAAGLPGYPAIRCYDGLGIQKRKIAKNNCISSRVFFETTEQLVIAAAQTRVKNVETRGNCRGLKRGSGSNNSPATFLLDAFNSGRYANMSRSTRSCRAQAWAVPRREPRGAGGAGDGREKRDLIVHAARRPAAPRNAARPS